MPGEQPLVFGAPYPALIPNNGIDPKGGFSDWETHEKREPHFYTFNFADGTSVSYFTLRMLNFGDYNPSRSKLHSVRLVAITGGEPITLRLRYTSDGLPNPRFSEEWNRDLRKAGDEIDEREGEPGKWTWEVKGSGIVRVELRFDSGHDPYIGFDRLCFVPK